MYYHSIRIYVLPLDFISIIPLYFHLQHFTFTLLYILFIFLPCYLFILLVIFLILQLYHIVFYNSFLLFQVELVYEEYGYKKEYGYYLLFFL